MDGTLMDRANRVNADAMVILERLASLLDQLGQASDVTPPCVAEKRPSGAIAQVGFVLDLAQDTLTKISVHVDALDASVSRIAAPPEVNLPGDG